MESIGSILVRMEESRGWSKPINDTKFGLPTITYTPPEPDEEPNGFLVPLLVGQ